MPDDELIEDYDDSLIEEDDYAEEGEEAAEDPAEEVVPVEEDAPEEESAPPAPQRYTPPVGSQWGQEEDAILVEALESMDPQRMRDAIRSTVARQVQSAVMQAVSLMAPDDPIEAAVRHNLATMSTNNPAILSDPRARQAAEAMAVLEVAQQNQRDPWEMMQEYAAKKRGASVIPVTTPVATRSTPRSVPAAQRVPTPSVAPAPTMRQSSASVSRVLGKLLDMGDEEIDLSGFRKSTNNASLRGRKR